MFCKIEGKTLILNRLYEIHKDPRELNNIINDIKFSGEGCAISIASASLMTEKLKGMKLSEAQSIFNDFTKLVKGDADTLEILNDEDSLYALKGVEAFPMRVKCATLAWHTFKSAVENK